MKNYKIKMLPTTPLTISCKYLNCTSLVRLLLTLSSGMRSSLHWVVYEPRHEVKSTDWDISSTVIITQQKKRSNT